MDATITDEELAGLVRRTEEAAGGRMRGDMNRYLDLVHHAAGFTLLPPTGGPASRHQDRTAEFSGWVSPFADGEARLEHVEIHAWGDTVVLARIERQHGRVGNQPDQNLSMRVTHVYRRDGSDWELVHRHADPLVAMISPDQLHELMRR